MRATGLSEEAARRTGIHVERIKVGAYVFCAVLAVAAGLFLAVQVAVGQNGIASTYALPAFTACFLGGAALTGGRGSFVGAVLGAVFLTLLVNVTPLLELNSAWAQTATGVLTIIAVVAYSLTGDSRRAACAGAVASPTPRRTRSPCRARGTGHHRERLQHCGEAMSTAEHPRPRPRASCAGGPTWRSGSLRATAWSGSR